MNNNNYCVIMAGGVGTRFWPMSRTARPKQFIDILGTGQTLIQQTFERFKPVCPVSNIFVVTHERYFDLVREQLPQLPLDNILCEPTGRNTAPCIAYASYRILGINPEANIVVAPSDHIILKEDVFIKVILTALETVSTRDWLLTLGIRPSRPDTGYGYIQYLDSPVEGVDVHIKKVKTFTEKPNLELAKTFLTSGDFLWNAGIFIWNIRSILKALDTFLPDVSGIFAEGRNFFGTDKEKEFINYAYAHCKSISIDYGVMEKAENVYTYASDFGWSDLGTWGSLYENRPKDNNGNAIIDGDAVVYDTYNCIINIPKSKLLVVQGLDNYIIAEDENMMLICHKEHEQKIRDIVNDIKINKGEEYV